jgi:hypothetical protein
VLNSVHSEYTVESQSIEEEKIARRLDVEQRQARRAAEIERKTRDLAAVRNDVD